MNATRKQVKTLIELSNSFEEANEVVEGYTGYKDCTLKLAYLRGMFDCEVVGSYDDEAAYCALLTAVVDKKWTVKY